MTFNTTRPDHIRCIQQTLAGRTHQYWCGRPAEIYEWAFTSIDHAAQSQIKQDRLMPCPECIDAAVAALRSQL